MKDAPADPAKMKEMSPSHRQVHLNQNQLGKAERRLHYFAPVRIAFIRKLDFPKGQLDQSQFKTNRPSKAEGSLNQKTLRLTHLKLLIIPLP